MVTVAPGTAAARFVDVLTEADRAVYDAKRSGRDRVSFRVLAQDPGAGSEDAPPPRPGAQPTGAATSLALLR